MVNAPIDPDVLMKLRLLMFFMTINFGPINPLGIRGKVLIYQNWGYVPGRAQGRVPTPFSATTLPKQR